MGREDAEQRRHGDFRLDTTSRSRSAFIIFLIDDGCNFQDANSGQHLLTRDDGHGTVAWFTSNLVMDTTGGETSRDRRQRRRVHMEPSTSLA
jgi:hypothetical protein